MFKLKNLLFMTPIESSISVPEGRLFVILFVIAIVMKVINITKPKKFILYDNLDTKIL